LQGVVARVRRKPPPGMFPGGAALTGATRCGRPGQAQAATRDVPPVAQRLPGLQGVVARVRRKPPPGIFPR
ncbi:hypothetical protein ACTFJV_15740, partial [Klebsiella electrica]|uniref:hypothetical protein n=1 Tax=Klebsiella electrica TaxID=1259973 RepID=UPI003F757824